MNTASHELVSPAAPHDHRDNEVVARLQSSQIFRDYQEAFQTATGLPLVLRATGSFQLPLEGARETNAFCQMIGSSSKACAACLGMQQRMDAQAPGEAATLQCFAGLYESVVPIKLGDRTVAFLQTGQVLFRPPTQKAFKAVLGELEKWKAIMDVDSLKTAFFETRVLAKARYGAVLRLLSSFAQHLSLLSNELMIKSAAAEPPAVAKARAFIADHIGEPLALGQVARAANMSAFYFCKIFKGATGLTFTDYLSRARVEKTKQLLLNPHVRVSEAAYEAGFQSLSQFNRVFRRVTGESPSEHRERIHPPAGNSIGRNLAIAA
jgi:AraC-like DNA-binding protein/ligand-binding sensor protein